MKAPAVARYPPDSGPLHLSRQGSLAGAQSGEHGAGGALDHEQELRARVLANQAEPAIAAIIRWLRRSVSRQW
jgi:hypothetical protein